MSFWPDDINSDDVLSPRDIMQDAGDELQDRNGTLAVSIDETRLDDRVVLAFVVYNRKSNVTLNLFEASHRISLVYPVAINPPAHDIPEFLAKQRYVPGQPGTAAIMRSMMTMGGMTEGTPGRYVNNEWVCATPYEFKNKLTEMFAQDYLMSRIIGLLATTGQEASEQGDENRDTGSSEGEDVT